MLDATLTDSNGRYTCVELFGFTKFATASNIRKAIFQCGLAGKLYTFHNGKKVAGMNGGSK